jgi:hypothetical protein
MPVIDLDLDGDAAWPDLITKPAEHVMHLPDVTWRMAVLDGGMHSGQPSIALRIDIPYSTKDGTATVQEANTLVTETSWAALAGAVKAIVTRYGWPE